jgi:hypothetical protein
MGIDNVIAAALLNNAENVALSPRLVGIDDIIAAALLSLIMLRRLEVRSARLEWFPHVPPAEFESWRKMVLSAYRKAALACFFKVVLTMAWVLTMNPLTLGQPYYGAVPAVVFVAWVITLVSAWQRASEAKTVQERLGIVLRSPGRNAS